MEFIKRFEKAQKLWRLTVPGVAVPPHPTIVGWLGLSTDREYETAVLRIPHRIRNWEKKYGRINAVEVYKFVTTQLTIRRRSVAVVKVEGSPDQRERLRPRGREPGVDMSSSVCTGVRGGRMSISTERQT